MSIEAR